MCAKDTYKASLQFMNNWTIKQSIKFKDNHNYKNWWNSIALALDLCVFCTDPFRMKKKAIQTAEINR